MPDLSDPELAELERLVKEEHGRLEMSVYNAARKYVPNLIAEVRRLRADMKLTLDQIAEIRQRHEMKGHSDYIWADVSALLEHIAAVERERDEARNLIEDMRELQREMARKPRNEV